MSLNHKTFTTFCTTMAALFAIFPLPTLCYPQKVTLDTASDSRGWKLEGDYVYIAEGRQLREFGDKLPPTFSFKEKDVASTRGIWAIFPSLDPTSDSPANSTFWTNTVTFSFATAAQLLDNVAIQFNGAGKSTTIKITSPNTSRVITPTIPFDGWVTEQISVGNSNRFIIEVATHEKGDFVLIDRIIATFVETTTTHRPRTSTTTTLRPKNEGCPSGRPTQYAVALTGMIVLASFGFFS